MPSSKQPNGATKTSIIMRWVLKNGSSANFRWSAKHTIDRWGTEFHDPSSQACWHIDSIRGPELHYRLRHNVSRDRPLSAGGSRFADRAHQLHHQSVRQRG